MRTAAHSEGETAGVLVLAGLLHDPEGGSIVTAALIMCASGVALAHLASARFTDRLPAVFPSGDPYRAPNASHYPASTALV